MSRLKIREDKISEIRNRRHINLVDLSDIDKIKKEAVNAKVVELSAKVKVKGSKIEKFRAKEQDIKEKDNG